MKRQSAKETKKLINRTIQLLSFLLLMLITFYTVFSQNDIEAIYNSMKTLHPSALLLASACAVFYVCAEGFMIWYLLRAIGKKPRLSQCFGYSFIGFFFSGITPSATGGQPAQLIVMKKNGISLGDATLTLMTVALLYKLVLVLIGAGLLLFWKDGLIAYLGSYISLYCLGLFLNLLLVILLLLVMFHGEWMERLLLSAEKAGIRLRLCKPSEQRNAAIHRMVTDYRSTFRFFLSHKSKILFVTFCTFLQRYSLFLLPCLIYRGMGLNGYPALIITALQASVYISVDMLPLPGSQGISELIYHKVFTPVFTGTALTASMCITRGISFYFPLILGAAVSCRAFCFRNGKTLHPKQIHKRQY